MICSSFLIIGKWPEVFELLVLLLGPALFLSPVSRCRRRLLSYSIIVRRHIAIHITHSFVSFYYTRKAIQYQASLLF